MGIGVAGMAPTLIVRSIAETDVLQQAQVYQRVQQLEEELAECRDNNYMDSEKCTIMQTSYNSLMDDTNTSKALYDYAKENRRNADFNALQEIFAIPFWLGIGLSIKPKKEETKEEKK